MLRRIQRLLTVIALPVAALLASAAVATVAHAEPIELSIQGRLTSANAPAPDGDYGLSIAFLDAQTGGNQLFKEFFLSASVKGGVFALALGAADSKLDSGLFANGKQVWVEVKVGGDPELPRQPLRRVPTAVHSLLASQAADLQCSGCVGSDDLAKAAVTGEKIAMGAVGANHVSFAWAAGDSPGGAATWALGANNAKLAEQAKLADIAGFADEAGAAKSADTAKTALGLQCTGCVGLSALADDVAQSFVSVKGGSISGDLAVGGKLSVAKELALGGATITGGQFAAVDVKTATCGAAQAGMLVMDKVSSRMYLCDGKSFGKIVTCKGNCKAPELVGCGQPLTDDCGDVCTGTGSFCASGACQDGQCALLGDSAKSPAQSCADLLAKRPGVASGSWWIKPGTAPAYLVYCEMAMDSGGWTLVGRIKGTEKAFSPIANTWTSATLLAADTAGDLAATGSMKDQAWVDLAGATVRVCYAGPDKNCANFTHGQDKPLADLFKSKTKVATTPAWSFGSLRTAWGRSESFSASFQWCGLNYATVPAASGTEVDINGLGESSAGTALRIGCIGDGSAGATGGPDDYALGLGVSSCLDGYGCGAVGNSDAMHWRDAGASGTYNLVAFVYVK